MLGDDLETIILWSLQGLDHGVIDDLSDRLAVVRRFALGEVDAGELNWESPFKSWVLRHGASAQRWAVTASSGNIRQYQAASCRLCCVLPSYPQAFAGTSVTTTYVAGWSSEPRTLLSSLTVFSMKRAFSSAELVPAVIVA